MATPPTHPIRQGPGQDLDNACVMQLVSHLAGEPWTDHPRCACPVVTAFLIEWNDRLPTDEDRTRLLGPLIPQVVGSRSTPEVERARAHLALDWLTRVHIPAWFEQVAALRPHADALRAHPPIVDAGGWSTSFNLLTRARRARTAGDAAGASWLAAWLGAGWSASAALTTPAEMAGASPWTSLLHPYRPGPVARPDDVDPSGPTALSVYASALGLVERMLAVTATRP